MLTRVIEKKNYCFYGFTINSQSKTKKVSWWVLSVGDSRNFHKSFFLLKIIIWTWIYFVQVVRVFFLKTRKKSLKRSKLSKTCLIWKETQKNIEKGGTKTKMRNSQTTGFFFHFNFLYKKIDILLENIFGKT